MLGGLGVGAGVTVTTLLAFELSGSAALAGLAASASAFGAGVAAAAIGASSRFGRRPGLVGGYFVGLLGASVAVAAAVIGSFPLMVLATFLFGSSNASNLQARYAVTDLATAGRRGSDLSIVVWATTVGAVLGPNLTGPGVAAAGLLGVPELSGPYLLSAAGFGSAALLLLIGLRPDPLLLARRLERTDARAADEEEGVPDAVDADSAPVREGMRGAFAVVAASPSARAAVATIAAAHAVMVGVMVMTPVHMGHHGADVRLIGITISLHILGMYAFSPVFGRLTDRFGPRAVLGLGLGQLLAAVALAALSTPRGGAGFVLGLLLLGTGWSAALIASSALLTASLPIGSRAQAQGLSDLGMNVAGGSAGALSGVLMTL
ncbi:MAG: MFS transporter, partial [Actinomycetota bacterium]|nr:MFS transporter [Actinomycetota bacterium]